MKTQRWQQVMHREKQLLLMWLLAALVGMEFESAEDRETVRKRMAGFSRNIIRAIREISPEAFHRIMGSR